MEITSNTITEVAPKVVKNRVTKRPRVVQESVVTIGGVEITMPYFKMPNDILPLWVRAMEVATKVPEPLKALSTSYEYAWGELMRTIQEEVCGFTLRGHSSKIIVSARVPFGYFWVDKYGQILVNEKWADERALDSDGDAAILFGDNDIREKGGVWESTLRPSILIKWPTTKQLEILQPCEALYEHWSDFNLERVEDVEWPLEESKDEFIIRHTDTLVGIKTNNADGRDLFFARSIPTGYGKRGYFGTDIRRYNEIEKGMKAVRGHKLEHTEDKWTYGIPKDMATLLKKSAAPTSMLLRKDLRDIQKMCWDVNSGAVRTAKKEMATKVYKAPKRYSHDLDYRLEKLGCLRFTDYSHKINGMVCTRVEIFDAEGNPVGLKSVKRHGLTTINYSYVVLPKFTWENGTMEILSPREVIRRELKTMWIPRHFGKTWQSLKDEPNRTSAMLQKLEEVCGANGYHITTENGKLKSEGLAIARMTYTVNYATYRVDSETVNTPQGSFTLPGQVDLSIALSVWFHKNTQYAHGLLGGRKGKAGPHQTYAVSHKDGSLRPLYAPKGVSAVRTGHIKSQLVNSHKCGEAIIAITGWEEGQTKAQMYATPAGIALQTLPHNVYLPRVIDPEVVNQLNTDYAEAGKDKVIPMKEHSYCQLDGSTGKVYLTTPHTTSTTGKIVTTLGTKNVITPCDFTFTKYDGGSLDEPVHFVMSQKEIIDKGCVNAALDHAIGKAILFNEESEPMEVLLIKIPVYRTLADCEISQMKTLRCTRFSGLMVASGVERLSYAGHLPIDEETGVYQNTDLRVDGFSPASEEIKLYVSMLREAIIKLGQVTNGELHVDMFSSQKPSELLMR